MGITLEQQNVKAQQVDEQKVQAILGKIVGEFGSTISAALMVIGDKLGLYKAMAGAGPITSGELARKTGTTERYVRDWLLNQAAGGYVEYDPQTGRYTLPHEHALALAYEDNPFYVVGGFELMCSVVKDEDRIREIFRDGDGFAWGEHNQGLFSGTERFFKPGYLGNLVANWLPALDGVVDKLRAGVNVADVGCGHGASTIIMARAFPNSRFYGSDYHSLSIERARAAAEKAGVGALTRFDAASANEYPGEGFELITFFDCLHDLGDPLGALRYARQKLAPDGTVMVVEPMAGERVEDNINPVGRIYSAASVTICTPHAIATGNTHLGTLVPDSVHRDLAQQAGFTRFRRAAETPFNRIFELRP